MSAFSGRLEEPVAVSSAAIRVRRDIVAASAAQEARNIDRLRGKLQTSADEAELLERAKTLIDKAIEAVSKDGIDRLVSVVSAGLQRVFQRDDLWLVINKKESARGALYEIKCRAGKIEGPFLETFGGGYANVAAFLLRLVISRRFRLAKLMVLDEAFNNVCAEDLPAVSTLLATLCRNYGYTILAVTHQDTLAQAADQIYRAQFGTDDDGPTLTDERSRNG